MVRRARGKTSKDLPARFFLHPPGGLSGPAETSARSNRPLRLLYSRGKRSPAPSERGKRHPLPPPLSPPIPGYNYIFASHALNKQTLSWSKTLSGERFLADWCGPSRALSSASISFVRHRPSGSTTVWRESSRRRINFSSDKDFRFVREMKV